MPKLFLSYARDDLSVVQRLEHTLSAHGYAVWRDQASIPGGQQWPQAIGEAIAANDTLLLVWSTHAAASHFVEFEWNTAVALQKPILPCLLDATPLPPALRAINGIDMWVFDKALPNILTAIRGVVPSTGTLPIPKPAKTFLTQWPLWGAIFVGLLVIAMLTQFIVPSTHTLAGVIWGENYSPLAGVEVSLPEFDQKITTDTNGRFSFQVKASKQRQVRLRARKDGYVTHYDDPMLNNPSFEFTMRREK